MELPHVHFSDLKAGRCLQRIVGRLTRCWEAHNIKKGGELMSVDLLLIDEKSTMMHGSIHVKHLLLFKSLLHEGSLYAISGFDVSKSNTRFKLTDFHFSIRFIETTVFTELGPNYATIPKELFRFRTHAQLLALGNTSIELPDIIGEITLTKAYRNENTQILERIMVHLRLESGEQVRLSAFDAHASNLHHVFSNKDTETCVMLATNVNPKILAGNLYLNATTATRFHFDGDVEATRGFINRLKGKGICDGETSGKHHPIQKIEEISIAELNAFLINSSLQEGEFLCTAEVVGIQNMIGWSYIGCSNCSTKMVKEETALACTFCKSQDAIGTVRFRVEMVVNDGTTTSVFVAFDKDIAKLIKIQASTLAIEMDDVEHKDGIPEAISDIVGKRYTFQIKLSPFNFTPQHRSFTVSRIYEKPSDAPQPTFAEEEQTLSNDTSASVGPSSMESKERNATSSVLTGIEETYKSDEHIVKKPKRD